MDIKETETKNDLEELFDRIDACANFDRSKLSEDDQNYYNENIKEFEEYEKGINRMSYLDIIKEFKRLDQIDKYLEDMDVVTFGRDGFLNADINAAMEGLEDAHTLKYQHGGYDLSGMYADPASFVALGRNEQEKRDCEIEAVKARICRHIAEDVKNKKYGDVKMTEIEKIVDKLENDIKVLDESTVTGKEVSIKRISFAIDKIKDIIKNPEAAAEFFSMSIPADQRAVNAAKDCIKDHSIIDKTFGPEMTVAFIRKLRGLPIETDDAYIADVDSFVTSVAGENSPMNIDKDGSAYTANVYALMLYMLAKKIESSNKSKDYKSLIYRAYILHYMLDAATDGTEAQLTKMFTDKAVELAHNLRLATLFDKNKYALVSESDNNQMDVESEYRRLKFDNWAEAVSKIQPKE